jgi:hypothetical protein
MRFWTVGHFHDEVIRVATLIKSGAEVLSLYHIPQTRATHFRIATRGPAVKEVDVSSSVNLLYSRITLAAEPQGDCSINARKLATSGASWLHLRFEYGILEQHRETAAQQQQLPAREPRSPLYGA